MIRRSTNKKSRFGTKGVMIASNKVSEDPRRECEVLGIKSDEALKASSRMRYWNPEKILQMIDVGKSEKFGRRWYEDIRICLIEVPSFKLNSYYNVVITLCNCGYCTQDEAWELFDIASKKLKRIDK